MAWATPAFSRTQVDKAGDTLARLAEGGDELEQALVVVNNWRSSHSFPLNTMQVGLRRLARQVDSRALIAQRIKRLSSIQLKLRRFSTMHLSQMQDIGGCRAVVRSVSQVDRIVRLYRKTNIKHKLARTDDYIRAPQSSGYRGVHLIYRYFSDRKTTYNNLQIEVQLRSQLQHAWATAVETVGTFLKQALKSSQGHQDWLRFFSLMGSAIALRERTELVPDTPTRARELVKELRSSVRRLDVERRLVAYGSALQTLEDPSVADAHFFLLALNPAAGHVRVKGFDWSELDKATAEYLAVERDLAKDPGAEAVLVSVESLEALRRAYPNYFLDTRVSLDVVRRAIA